MSRSAITGTNDFDLWRLMFQAQAPLGLDEDGIAIDQLPDELQAIVRADPTAFEEGDADVIDTDNELRTLLSQAIGADPRGLPTQPEGLQNLDSAELMALLIDWISNGRHQQGQQGGGGGRDLGPMGGQQFSGAPQPVSFGSGGGGGGPTGGGGGGVPTGGGAAPSSGPAAASYPTGDLNGDRAQEAMDYLQRELDLTPAQAAGIVGNLGVESGSGLDPAAIGDGGNALGIAQWNGGRMRALQAFAQSQGKSPTDFGVQLQFLAHELKTSESGALASLRATSTPQEAALAFSRDFERPGIPHNERRVALAEQAFDRFGAMA